MCPKHCFPFDIYSSEGAIRQLSFVFINSRRLQLHYRELQVMYGELKDGARKQGRPKLRYKDTLKSNLKWSGIQPRQLEACASDRSGWRSLTYKATAAFDEDRRQRLAAARDKRHRAASTSIQNTDFQCSTCGRLCASSFGLRSHMRRHR